MTIAELSYQKTKLSKLRRFGFTIFWPKQAGQQSPLQSRSNECEAMGLHPNRLQGVRNETAMAIGRKVQVLLDGRFYNGRIVDVTAGEMQIAVLGHGPMPELYWVSLPTAA